MATKHFSLEIRDNNRLINIFRFIFGVVCVGIAGFWLFYNFNTLLSDNRLWLTIIFLTGFGIYLIWSGLGYGYRFIDIEEERVTFRKNSFLKRACYSRNELEKIGFYPLKVEFFLLSGKKDLLRFGTSDFEKVEQIKDELMKFAVRNNIGTELINEMD